MGLVLFGYGIYLLKDLGSGGTGSGWYADAAVTMGFFIAAVALAGALLAQYHHVKLLRFYFVVMYSIWSIMMVICTVVFLFKDEGEEFAKHNTAYTLSMLPTDFCSKQKPYVEMDTAERLACSIKVRDRVVL